VIYKNSELKNAVLEIPVGGEFWKVRCGNDAICDALTFPLVLAGSRHVESLGYDFLFFVDGLGIIWRNGIWGEDRTVITRGCMRDGVWGVTQYMPEAAGDMWEAFSFTENASVASGRKILYDKEDAEIAAMRASKGLGV
jgi:hypothetical protein